MTLRERGATSQHAACRVDSAGPARRSKPPIRRGFCAPARARGTRHASVRRRRRRTAGRAASPACCHGRCGNRVPAGASAGGAAGDHRDEQPFVRRRPDSTGGCGLCGHRDPGVSPGWPHERLEPGSRRDQRSGGIVEGDGRGLQAAAARRPRDTFDRARDSQAGQEATASVGRGRGCRGTPGIPHHAGGRQGHANRRAPSRKGRAEVGARFRPPLRALRRKGRSRVRPALRDRARRNCVTFGSALEYSHGASVNGSAAAFPRPS